MKILTKTHVIYLKRKLRTFRIQIQIKKVGFVTKKWKKMILKKKISKGGPFEVRTVKKKISVFQIFKIFF